MAENITQIVSKEAYTTQLVEQKRQAIQNANQIIGEKLGTMTRLAKGEHVIAPVMTMFTEGNLVVYNDPILKAFMEKADELTREFATLSELADRAYLLKRQNIIFGSWQRRLEVVLDLNGKENRDPDLEEIRSRGVGLIRELSIPQFMAENLAKTPELQQKYLAQIEARGQEVMPDLTPTLQRIKEGKLEEKDWESILMHLRDSLANSTDWVKDSTAIALLGALPPHLRTELMNRAQREAHYERLVLTMLSINYLTIAQVDTVLTAQIQERKKLNQTTTDLEIILLQARNPAMVQRQNLFERAQSEGVKRIHQHRQVGHTNNVRQLLTFKGIAGGLMALNGLATIGVNVLMDVSMGIGEDKTLEAIANLPANKSLWMGVAMTGAGLEASNGFGGLVDKPTEKIGKWGESKDEKKERERLMAQNAFEREVMRYPRVQDLYFQFTEQINRAYEKKKAEEHTPVVELTLEEMNLNWEALPPEFKYTDKKTVEKLLSSWVRQLAGTGVVKQSIETQRLFIGGNPSNTSKAQSDCRVKYGLAPLELWTDPLKKQYLLNENIQ